eukprot:TRINITY_DN3010_c0_g2_i1.p1 TRINITY_DN3010_c0_g2~~TRINITY_DN3010_c0_g2_i1.p1  ORF type:complete len:1057 (+),score=483.76 TRINITY_DN3010_c0_g2_i1:129-3299(+)
MADKNNDIGMQRALAFSHVRQLPRATVADVRVQEDVYDRQVLLNELWEYFCGRRERPDWVGQQPHRDKWVTETWEEWERRKRVQPDAIKAFEDKLQAQHDAELAAKAKRAARTEEVLAGIAAAEADRRRGFLPTLHTLLLDFDEKRKQEEILQRQTLEDEETARRRAIEAEADKAWQMLNTKRDDDLELIRRLLEKRREEELRRQAEAEEERLRQEELAGIAAEEAEKERLRLEEEKKDAERRAVQDEKDRKAAERKARVMAERQKRQSKEMEAAKKLDERRRSSIAKADTNDLRREAARAARLDRQAKDMEAYLAALPNRVAKCDNATLLSLLYKQVTEELGDLLFDCAVYLSERADGNHAVFQYHYASANCSPVLRDGGQTLDTAEHGACPTAKALTTKDTVLHHNPFLDDVLKEELVRVGCKEGAPTGDWIAVPIFAADKSVSGFLTADTFAGLNSRQTLLENEADCYMCAEGSSPPAAIITDEMRVFLERVAELLSQARIKGDLPDVSHLESLEGLYTTITKVISELAPGMSCYISMLPGVGGDDFTVVAQNGHTANSANAPEMFGPHHNVIASVLREKAAPSFALEAREEDGAESGIMKYTFIPNVADDEKATPYLADAKAKRSDFLYLFPVTTAFKDGHGVIGVVGVEGDAKAPLSDGLVKQIQQLAAQLSEKRVPLLKQKMLNLYAGQCVQWCAALSGCNHVYLSLKKRVFRKGCEDAADDLYEYVAATQAQNWVVGKTLQPGEGITAGVVSGGAPVEYTNVAKEEGIHYLDEGKQADPSGQLVMAPVGDVGCLYMDTVGWTEGKKNFTKYDLSMLEAAGKQLQKLTDTVAAGLFEDTLEGETPLAVEKIVGPSHVRFLKMVYLHLAEELKNLSKQDLLEMARYNKPPEAIPPVCAATFIVMGKKPSVVNAWEKTRKLIKYPILEKMANFDPTTTKPAKSFFIRAKKMTKGMTVDHVATKGSVPTSLFFHWAFVNIQLRYAADKFKKLHKKGMLEMQVATNLPDEETEATELGSSVGDGATEEGDPEGGEDGDEEEGGDDDEGAPADDA